MIAQGLERLARPPAQARRLADARGEEVRWRRMRPCHRPAGRRREKRHEGSGSLPAADGQGLGVAAAVGGDAERRHAAQLLLGVTQDRDGRQHAITPSFGRDVQVGSGPASHSVSNRAPPWIATSRSSPDPVFVKPWASPGGLTTTWPSSMTRVRSPIRNVAWPASTTKTSAYGWRWSFGPTPGCEWTRMIENGTSPCSAPTNSWAWAVCSRSSKPNDVAFGLRHRRPRRTGRDGRPG